MFAPPNFDRARAMGLGARHAKKKAKRKARKKERNTPSERTREERLQIECSEFIDVSLWPPLKSRGERGVNTNCGAQTKTATRPRWPPTTSYENGPPLPWAKRKVGREDRREGNRPVGRVHFILQGGGGVHAIQGQTQSRVFPYEWRV